MSGETKRRAQSQDEPPRPGRRRMPAKDRKRQIIDAAITLFAESGFESSTHRLAERLGITQPLIYNHFPSKEDLIKAVYERVYIRQWKESWDRLLLDRARAIEDRLVDFYGEYTETIFAREWIRIYLFAGLKSLDLNRWYIAFVEERILGRIGAELRHNFGMPSPDDVALTPEEIETLWIFHGGIFYYGVRDGVYDAPVAADRDSMIQQSSIALVAGMGEVIRRLDLSGDSPESNLSKGDD